jgi:hypothetical protein
MEPCKMVKVTDVRDRLYMLPHTSRLFVITTTKYVNDFSCI